MCQLGRLQIARMNQSEPVQLNRAEQQNLGSEPISRRVSNLAQTGKMTWQPAVDRVAEALRDAYLDGPKVASMGRIPLGTHSEKVERRLKELGAILYFRGTEKERLLDQLHDAVADSLYQKLREKAPESNVRLTALDYLPDKVLLKKWVANNLFDLKFSTNKSVSPAFTRDISTPQTQKAIDTAFGASAAIVVAMGNKGGPKDATFSKEGAIAQKSLDVTARGLFNALEKFVDRPLSQTGDYGVHAEIKGLLDKGFNPKYGGIGRFPKPTDPEANARMLAWAFKKYSSDPNQAATTREAHEIHLRQLKYYQENLGAYLAQAEEDPNQADLLATQIHGTIGQIFNDILFNEKLNKEDRGALYDLLCDEGVLPDPAQEVKEQLLLLQKHNPGVVFTPQLETIHARRDSRLAQIAKLQTLIRSSPLLMEFNPREVSGKIAREAMGGLREAFGKDSPLAEEILADALVRTSTGQLDKVAGFRGRFPKIHEAIAQGINQRDKAIEKNCMNMPDARLDDIALAMVPELAGYRKESAQNIVGKIQDGTLLAHGMRPNTIQRANTLPANLQKLVEVRPPLEDVPQKIKAGVFREALQTELRYINRTLLDLNAQIEEIQDAARLIPDENALFSDMKFAGQRKRDLLAEMDALCGNVDDLKSRKSLVNKLENQIQSFAGSKFEDITVEDFQRRTHTLADLSKEKSVAKIIHEAGHRTLCSISGTTTDIGLALVAQFGEQAVKEATDSLLQRAEALNKGENPLPHLDEKFQSLFATLGFFMQGGQYHTPAEVLGGLLVLGTALENRQPAPTKSDLEATYSALLKDLARKPADYTIADSTIAQGFSENLEKKQNELRTKHREVIAKGEGHGIKSWQGFVNDKFRIKYYGRLGIRPEFQRVLSTRLYFDDSSIPSPPAKKFLINHSRDDSDQPLTPLSRDRSKAIKELRRSNQPKKPDGPLPFQSELVVQEGSETILKEIGFTRVDKNEFQNRNLEKLDFGSKTPAIRRHQGWKRERQLARHKAAEQDLAALEARQGKDITGPVKDGLAVLKNSEGFVPEFAAKGSSEQLVGDEVDGALGLAGYAVGMVKGAQKKREIDHGLKQAEDKLRRRERIDLEISKSKDYLQARGAKLKDLDYKMHNASLMLRMHEKHPENLVIKEQAEKLPAATETYEKGLANFYPDKEAHAKLLADSAKLPDKEKLQEEISNLRYKRGENFSKIFLRYPAGLAAGGTGLAATIGQHAGTIAAHSTAGAGLALAGKIFAIFGAISAAVSGWRIVRNWKENSKLETMVKKADEALAKRHDLVENRLKQEGKPSSTDDIDKSLSQDSLYLLLSAEKKSLKQKIKDNRIDSWGIELASMISGVASVAAAACWLFGAAGVVALGPIALALGLVGCAVGVGVAIHRLKREGRMQNRMADAQEGLAMLQNDPSKLEELRKSNPRVRSVAKSLAKAGQPVTADAVADKLQQFLSIRYVNVTAQDVYRNLLAELDKVVEEAKVKYPATSGRIPGPEIDPTGKTQKEFLDQFAQRLPTLRTLFHDRGLTPLEISRIVYAGSAAQGVSRLLTALNLKEIKTDSFSADANLEAPVSASTQYTALQSGSPHLHGNRYDSGMNAALTALKRNPSLASSNARKIDAFHYYLSQPMLTGVEARELRTNIKSKFFDQNESSRSANTCLEKLSAGTLQTLPPGEPRRDLLPAKGEPPTHSALLINRFDASGQPNRTEFDPLLPLTRKDPAVGIFGEGATLLPESEKEGLQPNTIICHKGSHRDRGYYITYTRSGTQWYRNDSGKSMPVDIRPENIAAKRALPHDSPEKRQFDLIHEELFQGCTAIVYGEASELSESRPQVGQNGLESIKGFKTLFDNEQIVFNKNNPESHDYSIRSIRERLISLNASFKFSENEIDQLVSAFSNDNAKLEYAPYLGAGDSIAEEVFRALIEEQNKKEQAYNMVQTNIKPFFPNKSNNSSNQVTQTLAQTLQSLGVNRRPALGDGNCFFNAIADQVGGGQQAIRNRIADRMQVLNINRRYGDFLDEDMLSYDAIRKTRTDAKNASGDAREYWGQNYHAIIAAEEFNRPVVVISPYQVQVIQTNGVVSEGNAQSLQALKIQNPIILCWNGLNHWDSGTIQ